MPVRPVPGPVQPNHCDHADHMARRRVRHAGRRPAALVSVLVSVAAATATLLASGCGGDSPGDEPDRAYVLHLRSEDDTERYRFVAEDPVDVRVGDLVTFELRNDGRLEHDLQVVDPDGRSVATADPIAPGATSSLTVLVDQTGVWQLQCTIDGHLEHGMRAAIEVSQPTS